MLGCLQMTERHRQRVGNISRFRHFPQSQRRTDHPLHLPLGRPAVPGESVFDFGRRIRHHLQFRLSRLIKNNPATAELHDDWRQRIKDEFPNINFSESSDFLSIINYIDRAPLKYYSKEAFAEYLTSLEDMKSEDPILLATILKESEPLLNIANKILTEINQKLIHDILLPEEHNDLINFIDEEIHYNLLKNIRDKSI